MDLIEVIVGTTLNCAQTIMSTEFVFLMHC